MGLATVMCPLPGLALEMAQCTRTTHVSHGGEDSHRDLGAGHVIYQDWWSQEGVFRDLIVVDCRSGAQLVARLQEERINDRPPFDRRSKAEDRLEREFQASPAFLSLDRLAIALKGAARDIRVAGTEAEPCACAALYPQAKTWPKPFELQP